MEMVVHSPMIFGILECHLLLENLSDLSNTKVERTANYVCLGAQSATAVCVVGNTSDHEVIGYLCDRTKVNPH